MGNNTTNINSGSQKESGNEAHVPPRLEGAVSGLALLQRKMEEIDLERKKFQAEQAKLSEILDTMLSSFTRLRDEMITMRKDMTQLSTMFRKEISDFKRILLAQNGTQISSPRRKRVTRASSKEESSLADDLVFNFGSGSDSKDEGKARHSAHRSKD
jgi:predicted ATP-dependent protease